MLVFAMDRKDILRLGQRHHQLLLILARMARNMDLVHLFIDDLCSQTHQLIDNTVDKFFVAGNRPSRDNDKVVWGHLDLAVLAHRHPAERGQRLTLAAGGNQDNLIERQAVCNIDVDQDSARNLQVAQLDGGCHNIDHAASGHRNLFIVFHRIVNNLLDAVDVGGKGRNNDSAVPCHLEQLIEGFADRPLARGAARHLDIGGVRQQRQNALAAQLAQSAKVDDSAFDWCIVYFKVSGLHNNSRRSVDCQRTGIRDRVVHADKFHRHTASLDNISRLHLCHPNLIAQAMLL